jgi:hypothetical protein
MSFARSLFLLWKKNRGRPVTISSLSPNTGANTGTTAVTITGTGFATGAKAYIGGTLLSSIVVVDPTSITAIVPAGLPPTALSLLVRNLDGGRKAKPAYYTPTSAAPTVSSISPNTGINNATTAVTITGTRYFAGATAKVGSTSLTSVSVVSTTSITAVVPASLTAAQYNVTVTNVDNQTGTLTNGYTVTNPAPTVTSISPSTGATTGTTAVTITGTGFLAGATAKVGTTSLTGVSVVSSTSITATVPASITPNTYNVTVTNTDTQVGTLTNGFIVSGLAVADYFAGLADGTNLVARNTPIGSKAWFISGTATAATATWNGCATIAPGASLAFLLLNSGYTDGNFSYIDRSGNGVGLVFRYVDDNNYWFVWNNNSDLTNISATAVRKVVAGVITGMLNPSSNGLYGASQGDKIVTEVSGASIKVWRNGIKIFDQSDSTHQSATIQGFIAFGLGPIYDNFEINYPPQDLTDNTLPLMVFEGDSITAGISNDTPSVFGYTALNTYPGLTGYYYVNVGVGGQTIDRAILDETYQVDTLYSVSRSRNIVVVLASINNSTAGDTPAQAYTKLQSLCQHYQGVGYTVIVSTLTTLTDGTQDAWRITLNGLITAGWATMASALVDYGSEPHMGSHTYASDTTYFLDGLHPTATGHDLMARCVNTTVRGLLTGSLAPTLSGISPTSGLNNVTQSIVITGTNLIYPPVVKFGTTVIPVTAFDTTNRTTVTVLVPIAFAAGTYDVTVINPGGSQATLTAAYTSITGAPTKYLWYKADAITGLVNNDPVASWLDSSPTGLTITQATGSKKPTYLTNNTNSLPVVSFNQSNSQYLASSTFTPKAFTAFTIFSVCRLSFVGGTNNLVSMRSSTAGNPIITMFSNLNNFLYRVRNDAGTLVDISAATGWPFTSNPHVYTYKWDGANVTSYIDGTLQAGTAAATGTITIDELALGTDPRSPADYLPGTIEEVRIFDTALGSTDLSNEVSDLKTKWGIP